jgi:hypothetical protein
MSITSPNIQSPKKIIKPEDITLDDLHKMSEDNFALWALTSGVKVDHKDVSFNDRRWLIPIYLDDSQVIAWQKAAQMGATIYMLLRILWWLQNNQGKKACLYMPNKELVDNTSKDRLAPLIRSCEVLDKLVNSDDKLGLKMIGNSSFYLFHLGGVSSKDSVPLDYVAFDEVRLCSPKDIDQALERISASKDRLRTYMSTAGLPETDINARFLDGTQHIWHSKCGCPDGCDLARTFPNCIVDDKKRNAIYLRCPKCKYVIKEPQNGRYVPHNPTAPYNSYHVSQLVSRLPLHEIWTHWQRTTHLEEFYNAKLGLPYVDDANRGVTKAQAEACIDTDLSWGNKEKNHCAMGVDQGAGYCMAIIADRHNDKKRIRHVEIIEQNNPDYMVDGKVVSPFVRVRELMSEYNVRLCVVDSMPNTNDAVNLAQDFPGRVFLAHYGGEKGDIIQWTDKTKYKATVAKAGPLLKFKYSCVLSRYKSLSISLGAWAMGEVTMPNPDGYIQMFTSEKTTRLEPQAPARHMLDHLCRLIKRYRVTNEETGEAKHEWIYSGKDPHLAHAWNYCNAALERLRRQVIFTFA